MLLQVVNRHEQCCAAPSIKQCCMSTRLFSHDNNVVTALFNHQYCYNLLTRLSNNDNNSEQASSINIAFFSCFNNREQPLLLHQCMLNNIVETIVNNIVRSTTLFSHDNRVVTVLFNQQCYDNLCYFQLCSVLIKSDRCEDRIQIYTLNDQWWDHLLTRCK